MPIVKSSRMTPISAAASTSSPIGDEAERVGADDDARDQKADDRHEAEAVADVGDDRRGDQQRRAFDQERRRRAAWRATTSIMTPPDSGA